MGQNDIKRLITGFLLIAVITGSATLALSGIFNSEGSQTSAQIKDAAQKALVPSIGEGAKVEDISSIPSYDQSTGSLDQTTLDPSNLTDVLANNLAQHLVQSNPNGPQELNGTPSIVFPENTEDIFELTLNDAKFSYIPPGIDTGRIKIEDTWTQITAGDYLTKSNEVIGEAYGDGGLTGIWKKLETQQPSVEALNAVNISIAQAQEKLYNLSVPEPLVDLHKKTLSFLEFHKSVFTTDFETDPLRALIAFENFEAIQKSQQQEILQEFEKGKEKISHAPFDESNFSPVALFLGVQTAYAIPVHDAVGNWLKGFLVADSAVSLSYVIKQWIKEILVDILKDQLVHRLVREVVKWIQGGGAPRFITNWKGYFKDIANITAGSLIETVAPRLCQSFGPLVRIAFLPVETSDSQLRPITCTLDQVVSNVKGFYDSFLNGGWLAYGASLEPGNNLFGAMIQVNDLSKLAKAEALQNAQQESQANSGFKSTKTCVYWDEKEMSYSEYQVALTLPNFAGASCTGGNASTGPNDLPTNPTSCKVKLCKDDGFTITTPGATIAGQLNKALGSPFDRIVNAQDLAALVSALINSALNKLIGLGQKGVLGLFGSDSGPGGGSGGGSSGGGGSGGGGSGGGNPGGSTDPCFGLSGEDLRECRGTTGGSTGGGVDETSKSALLQLADSKIRSLQSVIDSNTQWLAKASSTKAILNSAALACPNLASSAQTRSSAISAQEAAVQSEMATARTKLQRVQQIRTRIENATDTSALAALSEELETINSQEIIDAASNAQGRLARLSQLEVEATAAAGGSCSQTLSEP